MLKTTAKVKHRDWVPYGWIAIEFCDVDFYGFRAGEMDKKWHDITRKRYDTYDSLYKENETKIQDLHNNTKDIRKQVKESKPFYRFCYNEVEKEMLFKADNLSKKAYELEKENEQIKGKRFFNVYECHRKIEELLQQNGFVLTHASSTGEECVMETEIWILEE